MIASTPIAAFYLRVSSSKQVKNELPLEGQRREMEQWCRENGYHFADEFVYADKAITGETENRPALQDLMSVALRKSRRLVLSFAGPLVALCVMKTSR